MALVNCPYCGKQVSDKSEVCVHCGEKLAFVSPKTEEVQFEKMNAAEQEKIFAEFISAYPEHNYGEAGTRQIGNAMAYDILLFALCLIGDAIILLISPKSAGLYFAGFLLIFSCIFGLIVFICLILSLYRYNKKALISVKVFQKWLKEKKGMIYIPKLAGQKQQKIFDEINMENYPLR